MRCKYLETLLSNRNRNDISVECQAVRQVGEEVLEPRIIGMRIQRKSMWILELGETSIAQLSRVWREIFGQNAPAYPHQMRSADSD